MKKVFILCIVVLFLLSPLAMAFEAGDGLSPGDVYCDPVPEGSVDGYAIFVNDVRYPALGAEGKFTSIAPTAYPDPNLVGYVYLVYSAKNFDAGDKTLIGYAFNSWKEPSDPSVPLLFVRPAKATSLAGMNVKK